ncbi:MAG: ribose 5-phosphate isomerase B [Myxococcota bacterium]|nr:ribose 5-phosphate isomerase B [Myxococcota bacterium]
MGTVHFASDHAAVALRLELVERAEALGWNVVDYGPETNDSIDYPDQAQKLAQGMLGASEDLGVLVCGTGIGMSMAANRFDHLRAAAVSDLFSAAATRAHNNANVLCMGARTVGPGLAAEILTTFLATSFEGGRHQRRLDKFPAGLIRGDTHD